MSKIIEEQKEIEIVKETDVIVIGGGIAGISAAYTASKMGAKVTLIEKSIALGGLATNGLVCIYLPIDDGAGNKVFGGMAESMLYDCIKYGYDNLPDCWRDGPMHVDNPSGRYRTNFNIPAAVLRFDEMMQEAGVDVMFDTAFCAPIMEGNTVKGVICENKSGRTAFMAKVFIDASGDADLIYRAGGDTFTDPKNIVSSWTHEVDPETFRKGMKEGSLIKAVPLRWFGLRPDVDNSNAVIPKFDGTDANERNEYIFLSRKLMLDYLKKNQRPDYCFMTYPTLPQTRMTRRLVGKGDMDTDKPYEYIESSVGCVTHCMDKVAPVYEYPYEALYTEKLTNVLAAGRMVSTGTTRGWEIMRSIPHCALTGEVSGTAAVLAIKGDGNVGHIDVKELQGILEANGNILHCTQQMKDKELDTNDYHKNAKVAGTTEGIKLDALSYDKNGH